MEILYGSVIIIIGVWLFVSSVRKSKTLLFSLFVARSKLLWKNNVYTFLIISGIMIIVIGLLIALNIVALK
jgi:hypothetical protein